MSSLTERPLWLIGHAADLPQGNCKAARRCEPEERRRTFRDRERITFTDMTNRLTLLLPSPRFARGQSRISFDMLKSAHGLSSLLSETATPKTLKPKTLNPKLKP